MLRVAIPTKTLSTTALNMQRMSDASASLPVPKLSIAFQTRVDELTAKQQLITDALSHLHEAKNKSPAHVSNAKVLERAAKEIKEPVSNGKTLWDSLADQLTATQAALERKSETIRSTYEQEKGKLIRFNFKMLEAVRKAAERYCKYCNEWVEVLKQKEYSNSFVEIYFQHLEIAASVFDKIHHIIVFDAKAKKFSIINESKDLVLNYDLVVKSINDVLRYADELLARSDLAQLSVPNPAAVSAETLGAKLDDIAKQAKKEIPIILGLLRDEFRSLATHVKLTLGNADRKQMSEFKVTSGNIKAQVKRISHFDAPGNKYAKTPHEIELEATADRLIAKTNLYCKVLAATEAELEQNYNSEFKALRDEIEAPLVAKERLSSDRSAESRDNYLKALQKDFPERSLQYFENKITSLTAKYGSKFGGQKAQELLNEYNANKAAYNRKKAVLGRALNAPQQEIASARTTRVIVSVDYPDEEKPPVSPSISRAEEVKPMQLKEELLREVLFYFKTQVLSDDNMENFFQQQATTWYMSCFAYKIRIGEGENRKFISVPTGVGRMRDMLANAHIEKMSVDNLRQLMFGEDARNSIAGIIQDRKHYGKGRSDATRDFLGSIDALLEGGEEALTQKKFSDFKRELFEIKDKKNLVLHGLGAKSKRALGVGKR